MKKLLKDFIRILKDSGCNYEDMLEEIPQCFSEHVETLVWEGLTKKSNIQKAIDWEDSGCPNLEEIIKEVLNND